MYNFCIQFDKNYLTRGLALFYSLKKFLNNNFVFWILCFDDISYQILLKLDEPEIKLIKLGEFENEDLKRVKKQRTFVEYAWTCSSNLMLFLLEKKNIDSIIYLDSDLYFFNSPENILNEIEKESLAIVGHNYSKERKYLEKIAGKFNVSFVYAKNNLEGRQAIKWWAEKVIEWCYDRYENDKFGDQKYLDKFPELFPYVYIIKNKGSNVAPWNINSYEISLKNGKVYVDDQPLIFYHFHRFYLLKENKYIPASRYYISNMAEKYIYKPYFEEINKMLKLVRKIDSNFNYGFKKITPIQIFIETLFKIKITESIYLFLSKIKHY